LKDLPESTGVSMREVRAEDRKKKRKEEMPLSLSVSASNEGEGEELWKGRAAPSGA